VVGQLNTLRHQVLYREDPLPLPVSFLLDTQGHLRAIYTGRVEVSQLVQDVTRLSDNVVALRDRAVPFPGRWSNELFVTNPIAIATIYRDEQQYADAIEYLQRFLNNNPPPTESDTSNEARIRRRQLADVYHLLGQVAIDQQQPQDALKWLRNALEYHPGHFNALVDSADLLMRAGRNQLAADLLTRANQVFSADPDAHNKLGLALLNLNRVDQAIRQFETALKLDSNWFPAANNLAWLLATHPSEEYRDGPRAVQLAERIAQAVKGRADVLDTLAAAYAEAGDFQRAAETARLALEQARRLENSDFSQKVERRLRLYEAGQPYRD
jgi:tetratricopeptide (TPR) repeat protein